MAWWQRRFDPWGEGDALPPMILDLDDLDEIKALIESRVSGPVLVEDADNRKVAIEELEAASDHALGGITIHYTQNEAQGYHTFVSLSREWQSHVGSEDDDLARDLRVKLFQLGRKRPGVRRAIWSLYVVFAIFILVVTTIFALRTDPHASGVVLLVLGVAAALGLTAQFVNSVANHVVFKFTGTKIDPVFRKKSREDARSTRRDLRIGSLSAVGGALIGWLLGKL